MSGLPAIARPHLAVLGISGGQMESRIQSAHPVPPAWVVMAVEKLLSLFKDRPAKGIWSMFDMKKIGGEACLIMIAFLGTPWRTLLAIQVAALGILRVRDIKVPKPEGTAIEAATDGLMMASAVVGAQLYFALVNRNFATLQPGELFSGTGLAMLLIAAWRLVVHLCTLTNDLSKLPESKVFVTALRVTVLLLVAAWLIAAANTKAVPGSVPRNFLLGVMTNLSMALSCKFQMKTGRRVFGETDGTMTLMTYSPDRIALDKAEALPKPISALRNSPDVRLVAFFRGMFVACVLSTTGIAIWRWFFGDPSNIRWGQLLANVTGFAILTGLWHIITYFNQATAALIRRGAIERRAI
jgi:hypothetical protein